MATAPTHLVTPEQYLAIERSSDTKNEYVSSEMFAMAGASFAHAKIVANLSFALQTKLRGGPCVTLTNDIRVSVAQTAMYTYPDLVVVCGDPEFADAHRDTLINPRIIVEVLSRSTENWDRGGKFEHYRRLRSLQEYLLVSQEKPLMEQRTRQATDAWVLRVHENTDIGIALASIGCELEMTEVYDGVDFTIEPFGEVTP